jgi:hypothetical protein
MIGMPVMRLAVSAKTQVLLPLLLPPYTIRFFDGEV